MSEQRTQMCERANERRHATLLDIPEEVRCMIYEFFPRPASNTYAALALTCRTLAESIRANNRFLRGLPGPDGTDRTMYAEQEEIYYAVSKDDKPLIYVESAMGSGKTAAMLMLARDQCDLGSVPVFVVPVKTFTTWLAEFNTFNLNVEKNAPRNSAILIYHHTYKKHQLYLDSWAQEAATLLTVGGAAPEIEKLNRDKIAGKIILTTFSSWEKTMGFGFHTPTSLQERFCPLQGLYPPVFFWDEAHKEDTHMYYIASHHSAPRSAYYFFGRHVFFSATTPTNVANGTWKRQPTTSTHIIQTKQAAVEGMLPVISVEPIEESSETCIPLLVNRFNKVVVFTDQRIGTLEKARKTYREKAQEAGFNLYIYSSTSANIRRFPQFATDPKAILYCNYRAVSEGVNLNMVDCVVFLGFHALACETAAQCLGRIRRRNSQYSHITVCCQMYPSATSYLTRFGTTVELYIRTRMNLLHALNPEAFPVLTKKKGSKCERICSTLRQLGYPDLKSLGDREFYLLFADSTKGTPRLITPEEMETFTLPVHVLFSVLGPQQQTKMGKR